MHTLAATINAFVEDTCVIVLLAVLLARGRILSLLDRETRSPSEIIQLGLLFGAAGLSEMVFPGARFPYVTHTMLVTFSGLCAGPSVSLFAASMVGVGACIAQPFPSAMLTVCSVMGAALMGSFARRLLPDRNVLVGGFAAGVLSQVVTLAVRVAGPQYQLADLSRAQLSISLPANGAGVLLLALVVRDARVRTASERHRAEAEHARSLATQAQLSRLRARMHPHFLFNTLSSIAGLCGIAPEKAEAAIVRLGSLMRRVLESDTAQTVGLRTEIEYARDYLAIEQERMGERLCVEWRVDPRAEEAQVPPFSLQTLIENAIGHGIAPKVGRGRVEIDIRWARGSIVISVKDDGEGMSAETLVRTRLPEVEARHGLQILDQQLRTLFGARARLRLFSQMYAGTLVAFAVPSGKSQLCKSHYPR